MNRQDEHQIFFFECPKMWKLHPGCRSDVVLLDGQVTKESSGAAAVLRYACSAMSSCRATQTSSFSSTRVSKQTQRVENELNGGVHQHDEKAGEKMPQLRNVYH